MVKTYVRLPVEYQRLVVEQAHRLGMPLSSHYLCPAAALAMDGMEHTGATNRLGYSHTVSRLGRAYADVVALFTTSGMSVTPTLFNSFVLYAEDRSLVADRRTRILYPPGNTSASSPGPTRPGCHRPRSTAHCCGPMWRWCCASTAAVAW